MILFKQTTSKEIFGLLHDATNCYTSEEYCFVVRIQFLNFEIQFLNVDKTMFFSINRKFHF